MKQLFIKTIVLILLATTANAQERVIDATDKSPVSAASILDAAGNMVGFTLSDGNFTEIPKTAYPVTVRCLGYEQIVIERPEKKTWELTPAIYELDEIVIIPVERDVLKQTFYIREHFSMSTPNDTVTYFMEHMANRFVAASEDVKYKGNTSILITGSRSFSRYKVSEKDSVFAANNSKFHSMINLLKLSEEPIMAPESFKEQKGPNKLYEKQDKSGMYLVQRENGNTFTNTKDHLAKEKEHSISPWALKLLGLTMNIEQLYSTQIFRANDDGIYLPSDIIEAGFVMEAEGRGKYLRKMMESDKPVIIRSTIELYIVDRDYLTKEDAKKEYKECKKKKHGEVEFVIPYTVPPLDKATQRLVERATAETKEIF